MSRSEVDIAIPRQRLRTFSRPLLFFLLHVSFSGLDRRVTAQTLNPICAALETRHDMKLLRVTPNTS